jgi:hypothetical protein
MLRGLVCALLGAGLALGLIYGWQLLGHAVFAFPSSMSPMDPEKREFLLNAMGFKAQAWTVVGYPIGAAVAGVAANFLADARWPSVFVALVVAGAFFATLTIAPHPFWMEASGLALTMLAGVAAAAAVGTRTLMDDDPGPRLT